MSSQVSPMASHDTIYCPRLGMSASSPALSADAARGKYAAALSYFSSIPWTSSLLNPSHPSESQSPPVIFTQRLANPLNDRQGQLFNVTLSGPHGLKHFLNFFQDTPNNMHNPGKPVDRVCTLFALGEALTGHTDIVHGGMVMMMADVAMNALYDINFCMGKRGQAFECEVCLTATQEMRFLRPVRCGEVLVESWIVGVEGRHLYMECEFRDGDGAVLARSSSKWTRPKSKL